MNNLAEQFTKEYEPKVKNLQSKADSIKVISQETLESSISFVKEVEMAQRMIDEKRKEITKPMDEAKKAVQQLFMPMINLCEKVSEETRLKIKYYLTKCENEREKKQEKTYKVVPAKFTQPESTYTIKKWLYKVTDEFLVPREYLQINDAMLSKLAEVNKDSIKVTGVEFFCITEIRIKK